jgi:hypothetical protein
MSTIRCPKCKLINKEKERRCRRCGAPLSLETDGNGVNSKSMKWARAARYLAVPIIAVVSVLCIFGFYRYSKGVSDPGAGPAVTSKAIEKSTSVNRELEEAKKLNRDFIAQLDRNAADHKGDGLNKNQTLAFDTMMLLKEQQNKLADPAAREYLDEFCRLVEKYYDQMVRYNSESAHLTAVRHRIQAERERVLQDSSLSPEEKSAKQADLWNENASETQLTTVKAGDIDETVKSLRNLSPPGTAN